MYEVFERLLDQRGLKVKDVAEKTGIPQSTFTDWKKGRIKSMKAENMRAIADCLKVSTDYLMTGKESKYINYYDKVFTKDMGDMGDILNKYIHHYHEVSAGQGRTSPAPEQMPNKDGEIAKVVGDSMLPTLQNGDVVRIVETTEVEPTDIALVRINGDECTLKHCELTADGLWVRGENKDVFTDRLYTMSECLTLPVQIVGKAVEIVSRML